MASPPYLRRQHAGILLDLHVVPRAARTRVVGLHGARLKIQLAAPPADGKANRELRRFLGELLGAPMGQVELASGASSRRKTVAVAGVDLRVAAERLADAMTGR